MNRTIKPIERHMTFKPSAKSAEPMRLVAEWQQHGPETLSGYAVRKLRLAFAPTQSVLTASAAA